MENCIPIATAVGDDIHDINIDIDGEDDLFMVQDENDNGADEEEYHNASSLQYKNESEHESEEAYDLLESQRRIIVY